MRRVAVVSISLAVLVVAVGLVLLVRSSGSDGNPAARAEAHLACAEVVDAGRAFGEGTKTRAQFHAVAEAERSRALDAAALDPSTKPIFEAIFALEIALAGRLPNDFITPYQSLVRQCSG